MLHYSIIYRSGYLVNNIQNFAKFSLDSCISQMNIDIFGIIASILKSYCFTYMIKLHELFQSFIKAKTIN